MPEITFAYIAGSVAIGAVIGWISRGRRCSQEKIAVNEGWQQQLEAQRTEHERLLAQNKTLMEQVSQLQASGKDATNRARELSGALKEAFERRDQLQRELKEIRSSLDRAIRHRDRLQAEVESSEERQDSTRAALEKKDEKIFRLSRELESWQDRLPPLIERFRKRDSEAKRLEEELSSARNRIDELGRVGEAGETRIEPVDQEALGKKLDASNDPTGLTNTGIEEVFDDADIAAELARAPVDSQEDYREDVAGAPDDEVSAEAGNVADVEPHEETYAGADNVADVEPREEAYAEAGDEADSAQVHDPEPGSLRDNLRLIKGIGPAIEKTLNELGIFRYHQIAEMTEYDINRVARRLKGFSTRIYRENWIGQARELQLKRSGT